MKKLNLILILIAVVALALFAAAYGRVAYGQDAEPEAIEPVSPRFVEYASGEQVVAHPLNGSYIFVQDAELVAKVDTLIERIASLEATILSQADQPQVAPPSVPAININSASFAELDSLPGIAEARATAILAERAANGPYLSWADLMRRISGIGDDTVTKMINAGAILE